MRKDKKNSRSLFDKRMLLLNRTTSRGLHQIDILKAIKIFEFLSILPLRFIYYRARISTKDGDRSVQKIS